MGMDEKMELLNEIFEINLGPDDLDRELVTALEWDSFHIMSFLVMSEEQFDKKISIEQLAEVRYIRDLLQLLEKK